MSTSEEPAAVSTTSAESPSSQLSDDQAGVARFLMYTLSLPERVVRSTVGVTAGAAREAAHALVPQAFKSSKVYELVIANSLRFLTEEVGGVEHQAHPGEKANLDNYLARKAVGDFVDLAGLATLHLSPIWVFAVVSDVAYGSKTYLNELSAELRQRGLIRADSSIDRVEDLLDAIHSSTAETASLIATPPLSLAQLKQSVDKMRLVDPTTLLPQQELSAQWEEIRQIAKKEDVSLLGVSGALTMHMLKKVGAVAEGTLTGVEVAGGLLNRNVLGHYATGLKAVREQGFYRLILASSEPYRKAVWNNFAAERQTLTSQLVSGGLFRTWWDAAHRKFTKQQQGWPVSHERLWAPWRLAYVSTEKDITSLPDDCFLCRDREELRDAENLVVSRGQHTLTVLNRFPYNNGHVLVAPLAHKAGLDELDDAELLACMHELRRIAAAYRQLLRPDGFNVGVNLGRAAGAGVPGHLHWHLVPRWNGDTSFMTVVDDVRVISQSLSALYDLLKSALEASA